MYLSTNFTNYELRCRCARHGEKELCNVSPRLLSLAESVRAILNVPMIVTSCCRCAEHNKEAGGASDSKHLASETKPARAMDFQPKNMTPPDAYNVIIQAWKDGLLPELGGIGLYDTFIHIDTAKAEDGHLRKWDSREKTAPEQNSNKKR